VDCGEVELNRSLKLAALTVTLSLALPAQAEQVPFKIIDLLWLQHEIKGEGVEIVYQFERKPNEGDEALESFALSECNRVAPKYVQVALEKTGKAKADFVAITFRFGGNFGTYIKWFADYEDGACLNIE
jgi:hypothetical protein